MKAIFICEGRIILKEISVDIIPQIGQDLITSQGHYSISRVSYRVRSGVELVAEISCRLVEKY